jgi:hypothetical protein
MHIRPATPVDAARTASINKIDATIGKTNSDGLAYYEAMEFRTYRTMDAKVCKCFELEP